ncbi:MAG: hypothetical protein J5846_07280 [Desulfovibrio sp.]|nr:hypothetical protein [Desulfovibrio sp.]
MASTLALATYGYERSARLLLGPVWGEIVWRPVWQKLWREGLCAARLVACDIVA